MGMTGIDRAMLYTVALATGFRPGRELRPLTPEAFDLDADPPTITVTPSYTKNKQAAVQPIPVALAERLRLWLATKPPGMPVFEGMTSRTAEMLRVDLAAAKVPHKTSEGVADFYAVRVSYITNLVASGASVKTCQTLARYSTPVLTIGVYAKASLHDIQGAVESLPDLCRAARLARPWPRPERTVVLPVALPRPISDDANTPGLQAISLVAASDLKSSGGEPPCGFKSHRRYWTCDDSDAVVRSGRVGTANSFQSTMSETLGSGLKSRSSGSRSRGFGSIAGSESSGSPRKCATSQESSL